MSEPRVPRCIVCGCAISDDGPEQTDAWLASMCPEDFEASESSLREWDSNNADRTLEHEPRSAF